MTTLITPQNGALLPILNEKQLEFIHGERVPENMGLFSWYNLERKADIDYTYPERCLFSWECDREFSCLEISETEDFLNSRTLNIKGQEVLLNNFKAGQTYYWRVNGSIPNHFTTASSAPRFIEAEGVGNVRDAGAWKSTFGDTIRQGLLFRGSEMDEHYAITEKGIRVLKDDIHIHTDLDLRKEGLSLAHSPLGDDVQFLHLIVKPYGDFIKLQKQECKEFFDILADETNYPIYYHCWGGADRTGTLAFLLGAVLGMSKEDLFLDYEITSLCIWGDRCRESEYWQSLLAALAEYPGDTIREQVENFLFSCGVSEAQLHIIRTLFLESYK